MKLLLERWNQFVNEAETPVVHFMNWLVDKTKRVHSKPGQGSIFALPIEQVVEKVKEIASSATNVDEIAQGTGVLSTEVSGIGYDLVARVVDGKPVDPRGNPIEGEITTVQKEQGRDMVTVKAIVTSDPNWKTTFATDVLTVIIRPMKDKEGNVLPGEYIILSAFPGTTGADKQASEWGDDYVVVIPRG